MPSSSRMSAEYIGQNPPFESLKALFILKHVLKRWTIRQVEKHQEKPHNHAGNQSE